MIDIGDKIKRTRLKLGLTQEELAQYAGLCGLPLPERESQALLSVSEGWIAMIYLMFRAYAQTGVWRFDAKGMDALMEDRTVFVIAHRLSTVRNSNCIVVIEHGEIQEKGGHEDLLAQKGRYYMLYTGQHILD